jgi:hypothetical protein
MRYKHILADEAVRQRLAGALQIHVQDHVGVKEVQVQAHDKKHLLESIRSFMLHSP